MKAAFFDIDGVLTKGFVIHDFWRYLGKKGKVAKETVEKLEGIREKYDRGDIGYREMVTNAVQNSGKGLKGKKHSDVKEEMKMFLETRKIETFRYSSPLIKMLKENGFTIIAISGSNIDFIVNYKKILGLDEVYGTEYEVIDGLYTGKIKINMALEEGKSATVEKLVNGMQTAIGFGDTEQDIAILKNVNIPIALNPNNELRKIATERGWSILIENDDVVEEVKKLVNGV